MSSKRKMSKREMQRLRRRQIVFLIFSVFIIIAMIVPMIAPALGRAF